MIRGYPALAAYNAWANNRLFQAAAALPDEDYRADCGAFFKSVHGTLNHLLVTDRIWMYRFTGTGEAPDRLDAIPFDTLPDLWQARREEDRRLIDFIGRLDDTALAARFTYTIASTPDRYEQELAPGLDHLFNHQTHHRGQIHAILTRMNGEAPSLDLIIYQREAGLGGMRQRPA